MSKDIDKSEFLIECGREMAVSWMISAVEDSRDSEQMSNQIFALRRASIHVLATEAYNKSEQKNIPLDIYIQNLITDIRAECLFLLNDPSEIELIGTKGDKNADH